MLYRRAEIEGRKIVERPRESGSGETEGERERFRDISRRTDGVEKIEGKSQRERESGR
jgi:hypothetical protein